MNNLQEFEKELAIEMEDNPRAWHIDTRGGWLRSALSRYRAAIAAECEAMKATTPSFSLEDALEGHNDGDIIDAASRNSFNNALQSVIDKLTTSEDLIAAEGGDMELLDDCDKA